MEHTTPEPLVFRLAPTPGQETLLFKLRGCARVSYNEAVRLFHRGTISEEHDFYAAITESSCAFVQERPFLLDTPLITRQLAVSEACVTQRRLQLEGTY